ncbi:MAG: ATP-dependent RNA helicase [Spirochaetaceae bacterium]|jgi:RNA helicase HrpA|nr:ATP-dependent RNA helicase [Spirochaetaceae bacterium]
MKYENLPVYQSRDLILQALKENQVIVLESPTGSGKTTQLPVILYEAGFSASGIIGVTQPRRIAALSISEFITRQMSGASSSQVVGYKMRFADATTPETKIKIMTDGILLQEMKKDAYLSRYSCVIVDEAHERSLTIDFILGLLKRVLSARRDFKVIVSSATINAAVFSAYFWECPIVKIDAVNYPVTLVYDPPESGSGYLEANELLLKKISAIIDRILSEKRQGDILVFLPGEKMIKDCASLLYASPLGKKTHVVPLYGRLGKEEQERVFEKAPWGKTKIVLSTNIAETSVTIDGVTSVIDCGLSKLNFYNPRTFTSSLVEGPISKASAAQRKGRAGRTQAGICYRLYTRRDFEGRPLFTAEEIYRTDLSEVVLRMADLGITDFEQFDFISPPGHEGLISAIETLNMLDALEPDNSLSKTGAMMTKFPLSPRQSRIIVEAVLKYPSVVRETIIAAAFLSTQSPYLLPPGSETDARKAHHFFRDPHGDFVSYLKLYEAYAQAPSREKFCEKYFLDEKAMQEIYNVEAQLEAVVSEMGVPILSGGPTDDYLSAVAKGLIQFVCVRQGREIYKSLTAGKILIHPGSFMFKMDPEYIVAGEIIRTGRMYASSVSPISKNVLKRLGGGVLERFEPRNVFGKLSSKEPPAKIKRDWTNSIKIGAEVFELQNEKGRKKAILEWEKLRQVKGEDYNVLFKNLKGVVTIQEKYILLDGEKVNVILSIVPKIDVDGALKRQWNGKKIYYAQKDLDEILGVAAYLLQPALRRYGGKTLGFLYFSCVPGGGFRLSCSKRFHSALNESVAALETLIDELGENVDVEKKNVVNLTYRRLAEFLA